MGRKTLDAAVRMGGGSLSGSSMATYVFSRFRPAGEREDLVFINQSPAPFIRQLRKRPGKNIWLMGGGELARDFLKADLVDMATWPRHLPLRLSFTMTLYGALSHLPNERLASPALSLGPSRKRTGCR